MSTVIKIVVGVLALLYLISPYDAVPDLIPFFGQGDDLLVLAAVVYYLWRGRLPGWFRKRPVSTGASGRGAGAEDAGARPRAEGTAEEESDPYVILGVPRDADPDQVKQAYRQESQRYHPDKVAHLGPELQELAQKKFVAIQQAYETLRRQGGW